LTSELNRPIQYCEVSTEGQVVTMETGNDPVAFLEHVTADLSFLEKKNNNSPNKSIIG